MLKILTILLCLIVLGCGKDRETSICNIDISMTKIVWQGQPDEDATLLRKFNETSECLKSLNIQKDGFPQVIVTEDWLSCGTYLDAPGCYCSTTQTVYISQRFYAGAYLTDVYKHEVIHWFGIGKDLHESIYFKQCDPYLGS